MNNHARKTSAARRGAAGFKNFRRKGGASAALLQSNRKPGAERADEPEEGSQ